MLVNVVSLLHTLFVCITNNVPKHAMDLLSKYTFYVYILLSYICAVTPHYIVFNQICSMISGQVANVGERGEVCIKGPFLMKGYRAGGKLGNTRATFDSNGWMHTGII